MILSVRLGRGMQYRRSKSEQVVGRAARLAGLLCRAAAAPVLLCLCVASPARAQVPDTLIPIDNRAEAFYRSLNGTPDSAWSEVQIWLRRCIFAPPPQFSGIGVPGPGSPGDGSPWGGVDEDVLAQTGCPFAPVLSLTLAAAPGRATAGDTIGFTFVAGNSGRSTSPAPILVDTLPTSLRFVPGTVRRNGVWLDQEAYTLTDLADGRQVLAVQVGDLEPNAETTVEFRTIVVADSTIAKITNSGRVSSGTIEAASNVVEVDVVFPDIALEIRLLGRPVIYVGDSVVFELKYRNISDVRATNATLTYFLPPEMEFLAASPVPSAVVRNPGTVDVIVAENIPWLPRRSKSQQGSQLDSDWASWLLGTLQPGEEGVVHIHARLVRLPDGGGNELHNEAVLSVGTAGYTVVVAAMLAPITTQDPTDGSLGLSKKAGLLEVGLGEAVPYILEVENTGPITLYDLAIRDRLPEGLVLDANTVRGVDSVRVVGGEVVFYLPGPLSPGGKHLVRYAAIAVSATGEAVVNRAVAEAAFGRVVSEVALARVRIRRGPSLPSRTLIGKVWVDRNGNGRQDPGEEGVGGVDIWTTDGQIVRTDAEGRYSLQNLEAGRYTLRLDMLGLDDRYQVADRGGEIREVLLDGWTMGRADFRLVPREVLVDYHAGPPAEVLGLAVKSAVGDSVLSTEVRVAAARDAAARAAERRQDLIMGPGIEIFAPGDGSVVATGKIYIGAKGEPGRPVTLLGRDGVLREGKIRPDGVFDFIAVELEPGPNRFRVRTVNSWGQERWDSIAVHRSGAPERFEVVKGPRVVRAESPEIDTLHVRVLDAWGVPVVTEPVVTIEARGVTVEAADIDRGTAGVQLRADRAGWVRVPVRGGERAGQARLVFGAGKATAEEALEVLTPVRPLFATVAGRIGIGGAEDGSFASITARGALDETTSLTLNYDTRRGDREGSAFGRDYDPLDESLHPVTGDRSQRRVVSGSTNTFSARIERGQDWISFGDVRTEGFAGRGKLTTYDRALTGVSTRIGRGNVVWHGFGSATRQLFEEVQLRGDGSSGPYRLGGRVRAGTDVIAIELRAADNAARVLARTELQRYVDYQIDYRTGEVLLNRLLPAADAQGNPYFLVASVERLDGDERHWTGGVRVEVDASGALRLEPGDSLAVSVFGIHDGGAVAPGGGNQVGSNLIGGEVNARVGSARVGLEVLQASADSTGVAGRAAVEWSPWRERALLRGEWMGVGSGFSTQQQSRLRTGVEELRLGGAFRVMESLQLELGHDRQSFRDHGVERRNSQLRLAHTRGERAISLEGGLIEEERAGAATMNSVQTRLNARLSQDLTVWVEGRQALNGAQTTVGRSQFGVGATLRLLDRVRVEGQHRRIDADEPYSVSSVMLNVEPWQGGQLKGGLESATGTNADRGLTLGWSQQLRLPAGWSLSGQFERRVGLDDLSLADPLRALPFPQVERDRLSAGLGVQWNGRAGERTFSARGEYYDGDLRSGYRFEAQGDINIGKDVALLARHDWLLSEEQNGTTRTDRRDHSLLGVAFRPTGSNTLNALAKVEWRRTLRPDGGTGVDPTLAGDNARLIGSADLIWLPFQNSSVTLRYAIRGSRVTGEVFGGDTVRSRAHFFGSTLEQRVRGRVWGRLDSRVLHVGTTGDSRWSVAPAVVVDLAQLELEGGYRFGNLRDIDFAGRGGLGFFASIGVRLTESTVKSAAGIWRGRLSQ